MTLEEINRRCILVALRRHNNNRTHAAESLGISVRTLQRKLKSYRINGYARLASTSEKQH